MIIRKYSEILKEKEEIAQDKLKQAKTAIAVSLKEGILLLAANPDLKFNKIYPLYDRIACMISGYRPDFMKIYEPLRIAIQDWADFYSEGDIVLKKLAEKLAGSLKDRYENTGIPTPFMINIALVEVAPNKNDDILIRIDFKGNLTDCNSYLVLGNRFEGESLEEKIKNLLGNGGSIDKIFETLKADSGDKKISSIEEGRIETVFLEEKVKKFLEESYSSDKIFSELAEINKGLHQANGSRLETVFLNRKKVIEKEFKNVFQRKEGK